MHASIRAYLRFPLCGAEEVLFYEQYDLCYSRTVIVVKSSSFVEFFTEKKIHVGCVLFSSPEPLGSQVELLV